MTSDPSPARRMARLENDRDSLDDLITVFRAETRATFAQIDRRLDRIDARLTGHDARFDQHDARFDRIDESLAEILRRLPESA